jgi:hypothetical protein
MNLAECAKGELLENANNTCILTVRFWHKADTQKLTFELSIYLYERKENLLLRCTFVHTLQICTDLIKKINANELQRFY